MEEVNLIAEQPNTVVISCNMRLNFDGLLEKIWEHLDLVRVYTKKANENPDFGDPIVLTNDRNGCSVRSVCEQIHKDLPKEFKYAKVWYAWWHSGAEAANSSRRRSASPTSSWTRTSSKSTRIRPRLRSRRRKSASNSPRIAKRQIKLRRKSDVL